MTNPVWITQMNLGSTPGGVLVNPYLLIADAILPALSVTYNFVGGTFPLGLTVNSNGTITGTPNLVNVDTVYNFIIKATDNLGNSTNKTFTLKITVNPQLPIWNTPAGSLGTIPSTLLYSQQLSASPVIPATTITYSIISGSLPPGLTMSTNGLISGTPNLVSETTTSTFVVRATDNLQNIIDRTFSITCTGVATPTFTTLGGVIIITPDSQWTSFQINYSNPLPTNPVTIRLIQGLLPPGLEINESGLIRGYPSAPTIQVNLEQVITTSISTSSINNSITCISTEEFIVGRPVIFTGSVIGGVVSGVTYYVKEILSPNSFTISDTVNGLTRTITNGTGSMIITLPNFAVEQPVNRTYTFTLKLESPLGNDQEIYSILVKNVELLISPNNVRHPTIYNTRPSTFNIPPTDEYFGYYVLPPGSEITGNTYAPNVNAYIGQFYSGDEFNFKIIGHDFDNEVLTYEFSTLPFGLSGDNNTGWITGTPIIDDSTIEEGNFIVTVKNESLIDYSANFSLRITNGLSGNITWITPTDLGSIFNGIVSTKFVQAISDVELTYELTDGSLPPNLELLDNGEITGIVAFQPTTSLLPLNAETSFTFTVKAYSNAFPNILTTTKQFTINVIQKFDQPTDTLYIKCTPSIENRILIDSLLNNEQIIPTSVLYRPDDIYFGKATNVTYVHAYGINASNINEYLDAVTKNHYWRNITLGELSTAVAKDVDGNILYEVVYSNIIDDLLNPKGVSVPEEIFWPRFIPLSLGPWYTSVTNIYTSYIEIFGQEYYTSLTPGFARILYPNSLPNMRNRVGQELGQVFDSNLLPLWMTSQQSNGSTLGFTPAWVICYTKPGFSQIVKNNIETSWPYKLNQINFEIDKFSVNKSITYDYNNAEDPPSWTELPSATPVPNPLNSDDFNVLFPQKTILPNKTQY